VLIAFYYGVTGLACAWAYRKVAFQRVGFFFSGVLLPFLGGLFFFGRLPGDQQSGSSSSWVVGAFLLASHL